MAPLYLGWAYQEDGQPEAYLIEAERWFLVAIERGEPSASYYLGHLYKKTGQHDKARDAFSQGASKGHLPSMYCLAKNLLRQGHGSAESEKAMELLKEASRRGHVFAIRAMASMYLSNRFGWFRFPYGCWLWIVAVGKGLALALSNSDDDRLKG
jgi:TPR repeat protein